MSSEINSKVKEFYESIDAGSQVTLNSKKRMILSLLNRYINKEIERILDVGAGDGFTLNLVRAREKYGIDINNKNIQRLRAKGIKAYLQDVQDPFPFPNDYFDVVISEDVLEHLFFPDKTLAEIYRVLKPGGIFVGSVPNHFNWYHRLCYLVAKPEKSFLFRNAKHISDNFWTKKALINLIESAGFYVIYFNIITGHLSKLWPTLFGWDMIWVARK